MTPKKILTVAILVVGIGIRVAMSVGGDEGPASAPTPATAATAPAGSATQPVSQAASSPESAEPRKRVRQTSNFPKRFEKRVVKVCNRYERFIKTTIADKDEKDPEKLRKVIRATEDIATEFEDLKPPARNRSAWTSYTGFYRDASDLFGRIESEIADDDLPAFNRYIAKAVKLGAAEKRINRRYGFAECAND